MYSVDGPPRKEEDREQRVGKDTEHEPRRLWIGTQHPLGGQIARNFNGTPRGLDPKVPGSPPNSPKRPRKRGVSAFGKKNKPEKV